MLYIFIANFRVFVNDYLCYGTIGCMSLEIGMVEF